jgi:hypothetical protein
MQGPTGIAGVFGPQGAGFRGPTGATGPTGIAQPGYDSVTGPAGPTGDMGALTPLTGNIYTLSTYATGATGLAVPTVGNTGLTTIWSNAIPTNAKGKSGVLSVYFDMNLNYPIQSAGFDYGLYVDDAPLALGPSPTHRYNQNVVSSNLVGSNGTMLGNYAPTPLDPLTLPVSLSSSANILQIKIANASATLQGLTVSNTITALTTTGSNAYTTPVGSIGVLAYVWGCGGSPYGSNAGGPGGFSFGYYPCAAGTVLTGIVGALGTNAFVSGFGGSGFTGAGTPGSGGGFSGLFLGASPASNSSTPLVIAGGGGGCFVQNTGLAFSWVGGGGGGLVGCNTYNLSTGVYSTNGQGNGGTSSNAGYGAAQWNGYTYNNSNGAGGGGYFGGGGGSGTFQAGGGGSGYLSAFVSYGYMPPALNALYRIDVSGGAAITAPGSNIMSNFGYSPATYAHGGAGRGLILLVPVVGSNAPFIGVDARFSSL